MAKGFRFVFIIYVLISISLNAQERETVPEKEFDPNFRPVSVALRLSYENYKNIKLLHASIMNFGGGDAVLDKIIDDYAEASSLYFANKFTESANLFTKNEKEIRETAIKLAKKYKEDTETLHKSIIRMKIRTEIKVSFREKGIGNAWNRSKKESFKATMDTIITDGAHSLRLANDFEVRTRPIDAIYYYRRSKENFFKAYAVTRDHFTSLAKSSFNSDEKNFYLSIAEKYKFPEQYRRDVIDNQNKAYEAREKEK